MTGSHTLGDPPIRPFWVPIKHDSPEGYSPLRGGPGPSGASPDSAGTTGCPEELFLVLVEVEEFDGHALPSSADFLPQEALPARIGDTPAPEEEQGDANLFKIGGVDGTRTRDLRRDRRKTLGELINDLLRLFNKFRRHAPTQGDTKRPV